MIDVPAILALMLIIACIAFVLLASKFWSLRNTVIFSISEMGELMVLLACYDQIVKPEEQIARLLKMSPDDVRIEIERGRVMDLISRKAIEILATMKAAIPSTRKWMTPIEEKFRFKE